MLASTGVATSQEVISKFPDSIVKPKAIIECYEKIPCNPCSTSCPFGAITIGEDINNIPILNADKCTGCAVCVHSCPGLAIMVAQDMGEKIRFKIPYEMLPVPVAGELWNAVDRSGEEIGYVFIERVLTSSKQNKTVLVQLVVDSKMKYDFITIRRPHE